MISRLKTSATVVAVVAAATGGLSAVATAAHADTPTVLRIDTAPTNVTDSTGTTWSQTLGWVGGRLATRTSAPIRGTADQALYDEGRFGMTGFLVTVPNGTYEVTLKMAENFWDKAGARVFSVTAGGQPVLNNIDIFKAVGKNAAYDRTFRTTVTKGYLQLGWTASVDNALVDAIEVKPADTTPPVVSLDAAGPSANSVQTATAASFAFSANKPGVTFACRLDAAATTACTSPVSFAKLSAGKHTVTITGTDSSGNTSAAVSRSWTVALPPAVALQPGPSNTGVPAGTVLQPYYGNLNVTTPGAVYSGLDIHGFVSVHAPNVTIKDSIVRGGFATHNIGLIENDDAKATNLLVEDTELVPEHPSVWIDAIKGWNYTALRINAHGTVDTAKVYGPNATIENSWLHDTQWYAHDPNQGGGPTHNDGVQVLSGNNIHIIGNTITGSNNSVMQVTQDHGAVSGLFFEHNWADNGGCEVNLAAKPLATMGGITVSYNQFGTHTRVANCPIISGPETHMTAVGNVWWGTTTVALVHKGK